MCHLRTVQQRGAYSITSSGAGQQSWWDCETQCFGRLQVDDQLIFCCLLHLQLGWLLSPGSRG
jgi:hypothetical protein